MFLHNAEDIRDLLSRQELTGKYNYNGLIDENPDEEKYNFGEFYY